jgi:hypothetical protein
MNATARKLTPSISLLDETADLKRSKDYVVHLMAGLGSFSFAILDKAKNRFVALESYHLQHALNSENLSKTLDELVGGHTLLKENFEDVYFAYDSPRATLVPEALFDAQQIRSYIQFNHISEANDQVMSDQLKHLDTRNIYLLPENVQKAVTKLYPKARFRHASSSLLESLAMKYKNEPNAKLVVHVSLTHFEIILFEGKHLKFYNTFRHQTSEDFMYYLLFVCEQLKLNPESLELILIGEVEKNSAIYSMLYKYIRNIRFGERPEAFSYCHPMNMMPGHFYCNLFSQQLFL